MTKRDEASETDAQVVESLWRRFGRGGLRRIRRLRGGSRRTFECTSDRGSQLIVRLAVPSRARFTMESAVLRRCAEYGVIKTPQVFHVGVEEAPGGRPVAVMVQEKLPGQTLAELATSGSLEDAHAAVTRAGEILVAVHEVQTDGFGPLDVNLRGPGTSLGEWFIDSVQAQLESARTIDPEVGPVLDQAFELLAAHRTTLDDSCPGMVHGDYSPANLLVDEAGRISGIIDWEAAKSGPPEMDIGWWDCFFDTRETPAARLLAGYENLSAFDPARLSALRHLTVIRVMIGHFTWTLSAGDRTGIRIARDRLRHEVSCADEWRVA